MAGIDGGRIVIASIREWMERNATTTPWSMFCGVHTVICVVGRLLLGLEEEGGRLVKDWMERASDGSMIVYFLWECTFFCCFSSGCYGWMCLLLMTFYQAMCFCCLAVL